VRCTANEHNASRAFAPLRGLTAWI
jgi:hypothetical protein